MNQQQLQGNVGAIWDGVINDYIKNNKDKLFEIAKDTLISHKDEIITGILTYLKDNKDKFINIAELLIKTNEESILKMIKSFVKDNNQLITNLVKELIDQNQDVIFSSIKDFVTSHSQEIQTDVKSYLEEHKKQIEELVQNYISKTVTRSNINAIINKLYPRENTGNIFTDYFANQSVPVIESFIVNELYKGPERLKIRYFTILILFFIFCLLFSIKVVNKYKNFTIKSDLFNFFLANTSFFLVIMLGSTTSIDYTVNGIMRTLYKKDKNVKSDQELDLIEITEYTIGVFVGILTICMTIFWMKH